MSIYPGLPNWQGPINSEGIPGVNTRSLDVLVASGNANTDYNNIQQALDNGCALLDTTNNKPPFLTKQQFIITQNYTVFKGIGPVNTDITCSLSSGSGLPSMIVVGDQAQVNSVTIENLQLYGSGFSGDGIQWHSYGGSIKNMVIQSIEGNGINFNTASIPGAPYIAQVVVDNVQINYPGMSGITSDGHLVSSAIIACTLNGGHPNAPAGNYGMYFAGGNNIKLIGDHLYLFANGGVFLSGNSHQIIGGEYESNSIADIIFNNAVHCIALGPTVYDYANNNVPAQHVLVQNASFNIEVIGVRKYPSTYSPANFMTVQDTSQAIMRDISGLTPLGYLTSQPAVPASGTAYTNAFMTDCDVVISGGTVTSVKINGTATGLTSGSIRVPAWSNITLVYSAAPTWTWWGI